jgi:hypothetical protein
MMGLGFVPIFSLALLVSISSTCIFSLFKIDELGFVLF